MCRLYFYLQKLNEQAAVMFESGEEPEVTTGLGIMNELVVPCIPLLLVHDVESDLLAVEDMRNRWCSYLGQEMECKHYVKKRNGKCIDYYHPAFRLLHEVAQSLVTSCNNEYQTTICISHNI